MLPSLHGTPSSGGFYKNGVVEGPEVSIYGRLPLSEARPLFCSVCTARLCEAPVSILYLTFAILITPILFFVFTWAAVTAYRLLAPEKPIPFERDPVVVRKRAAEAGDYVAVGVREIREDQRLLFRDQIRPPYHYTAGFSEGLPSVWMEDLWQRRN